MKANPVYLALLYTGMLSLAIHYGFTDILGWILVSLFILNLAADSVKGSKP